MGRWPWPESSSGCRRCPSTRRSGNAYLVRDGLRDLPGHDVVDIRRWQTSRQVRDGLVDFLSEHGHRVNEEIGAFSMFSSKRIDRH